jgi:hypothetical protein
MKEREHNLVVRMANDEMHKLHAIAEANDESIARLVRRLVDDAYRTQFGDAKPPKAKLKNTRSAS